MPKLKDVEVNENSMSWDEVSINTLQNKVTTTIPKRELTSFFKKGKKIKKIIVEFS